MTGHERIKRQLTDLAAGESDFWATWQIRRHLTTCAECRAEWERIQTLWQDLRGVAEALPPVAPVYPQRTAEERTNQELGNAFARFLFEPLPVRRVLILPSIALFALLVAALLPQTGHMMSAQAHLILQGNPIPAFDALAASAKQHATLQEDFQIQFGLALLQPNLYQRRIALRELTQKYPDKPEAWATLVEQLDMIQDRLTIPAVASSGKEPWTPPVQGRWSKDTPNIAVGERLLHDIQGAERADPNNGLFTIVRSYVLLSLQRIEGIDAFVEASRKPYFKDYYAEQMQAIWRVRETFANFPTGLSRVQTLGEYYPTYSTPLRSATRTIFSRILSLEKTGQLDQALILRNSLLDMAIHMGSPGNSLSLRWSGFSIGSMALQRFNGQPYKKFPPFPPMHKSDHAAAQEWQQKVLHEFSLPGKASVLPPRFVQQWKDTWRAQSLYIAAGERYYQGMPFLLPTLVWSAISMFLLLGSLILLTFEGVVFLLARQRRIRRGIGLHPSIGWGAFVGLSWFILLWDFGTQSFSDRTILLVTLTSLLSLFSLYRIGILRGNGTILRRYGVFFMTLLATLCLGLVALTFVSGIHIRISGYILPYFVDMSSLNNISTQKPQQPIGWFLSAPLMIPLTVLVGLIISSHRNGIPTSVGAILGFTRLALPIVSLLLLVYIAVTAVAGHFDNRMAHDVNAMVQDETNYYAQIMSDSPSR